MAKKNKVKRKFNIKQQLKKYWKQINSKPTFITFNGFDKTMHVPFTSLHNAHNTVTRFFLSPSILFACCFIVVAARILQLWRSVCYIFYGSLLHHSSWFFLMVFFEHLSDIVCYISWIFQIGKYFMHRYRYILVYIFRLFSQSYIEFTDLHWLVLAIYNSTENYSSHFR